MLATRLAECIKLPNGIEMMPEKTELKDFLQVGESAIYK